MIVQLRYATLPFPLGFLAVHYWFTVLDPASGRWQRWEVWQSKDAGGLSFGHLHCDLKAHDSGVGGGPCRVDAEWSGADAARIAEILKSTHQEYPWRDRYLPWPGPNSNTFVAWVLRLAGIEHPLHWKAIGKHFA
jgi:hypothetical protein